MTSPSLTSNKPPGHAITPSANPQRHQGKPYSAVPWSRRVILCIWLLNVINTRDVTGISLHVLMVLGVTWRSSAGLSWGTRHIAWGGVLQSSTWDHHSGKQSQHWPRRWGRTWSHSWGCAWQFLSHQSAAIPSPFFAVATFTAPDTPCHPPSWQVFHWHWSV